MPWEMGRNVLSIVKWECPGHVALPWLTLWSMRAWELLKFWELSEKDGTWGKVHTFWEGHKTFAKSPTALELSYVVMVEISQNFVAFSGYMNFMCDNYLPTLCFQWYRNRGTPQYLADQLTIFEPGRADYPHLLLLAPSMFFTFRHHWF